MTELSINLNKIALIRNSRDTQYPSVVDHARRCITAGADGITVHPRPDQRHIRVHDCSDLKQAIEVELNIEGNPFAGPMRSDREGVCDYPGFMEIVRCNRPAQCTLVPDSNAQLTSDHGFDLSADGERLRSIITELKQLGVRVSLFMDPICEQIKLAQEIGADRIELYTGPYADACLAGTAVEETLATFSHASTYATSIGLGVNAGHDLNLDNLAAFRQALPDLLEVSIGHAFTVDCIARGLPATVAAYKQCLGNG